MDDDWDCITRARLRQWIAEQKRIYYYLDQDEVEVDMSNGALAALEDFVNLGSKDDPFYPRGEAW